MEFEPMTSREYRELGAENYETRRSLVLGLAEAVPEDATDEQISAIDAEVSVIAAEDQRRSQLAHTRNAAREFVEQGAGAPVAATEAVEETEEVPMPEEKQARSLGANFVQYREAHKENAAGNRYVAPAFRAATDVQTVAGLPATEFDTSVVAKPAPQLAVLGLFGRKTVDQPVYSWLSYGSTEGAAGLTAEGAAKNQLHYVYEQKSVTLQKVTGIIKLTEELFEDDPYLAAAINGDLVDDLNAARQEQAVKTLLATSGIQKATGVKNDAISILDAIIAAAADVEDQSGMPATAVAVTPAIWKTLRGTKLTTNEYVAGSPFGDSDVTSLFGMTFVKSAAVTANHVLVGAFNAADLVSKRDGVKVESTNSDQDDFSKNLVTVRAEIRGVLAVKRPAAFCDITVATA